MRISASLLATVLLLFGCATGRVTMQDPAALAMERSNGVRGAFGTYNAPPRLQDGRVDLDQLLSELLRLRANTYHWLIWHNAKDWDDLQAFLPQARKHKIKVWVTVVPPSESPPHTKSFSEPFRLDYTRWAEEIARLSVKHRNLVAWSIDDFTHNLKVFTPEYVARMNAAAHAINPKLAFVPCCYFRSLSPTFAGAYRGLIDGVLFPYRAESAGSNLKDATLIEKEINTIRARFGPSTPVILDIYATAHSRLGPSTPEYVDQAMREGRRAADGVLIYCHQHPVKQAAKFDVLKKHFSQWAGESSW